MIQNIKMHIVNLFKISYYFGSGVSSTFPYFWWVVGLWIGIFVVGLVLNVRSGRFKPKVRSYLMSRVGRDIMIASFILLAWIFMRYQEIPYLSLRIWPLATFLAFLIEGGWFIWFYRKIYPERLGIFKKRKEQETFVRRGRKHRR